MKRKIGVAFAAMALLITTVLPSPSAEAQAVLQLPEFVVAEATGVVNAIVASSATYDFDGSLYTVQDLEIGTTFAGELSGTIRLAIPGGTAIDGTVQRTSLAPEPSAVGAAVQVAVAPAPSYLAPLVAEASGEDGPLYYLANGDTSLLELNPFGVAIQKASINYDFNGAERPGWSPAQPFVINTANSGLGSNVTREAIIAGFKRWERDGMTDIDFSYNGSTTSSGIRIGNRLTEVSWQFPNATNQMGDDTLAVAGFTRGTQGIYEFDIVLNRNQEFSIGARAGKHDLETVIAHEVGHGLGLAHTPFFHGQAREELMYPSIDDNTVKPIGPGDLEGSRVLYPSNGVSPIVEPGHSVSANATGQVAVAAVKSDGRLYTRRDLGSGLSSWAQMGGKGWLSADITMTPSGASYLIAVKDDGRLFTRRRGANAGWGDWVLHGSDYSTQAMPSIASNGSRVVWAALSEPRYTPPIGDPADPILPEQKVGGDLRTREFSGGAWSGFTTHGIDEWARIDIDIADNGNIWFVGATIDQLLGVRSKINGTWSALEYQGAPGWSSATDPAIAASNNVVILGALKNDGRLYTRHRIGSKWQSFVRQGKNGWSSVDVTITAGGGAWLAAEKSYGRLYTRASAPGGWQDWTKHGADTWSAPADPSIAIGAGRPVLLAVKESGLMYLRKRTSSWGSWQRQGGTPWAVGRG